MYVNLHGYTQYVTASTDVPWQAEAPVVLGLHGGPGIDGQQLRYFLRPQQAWANVVVPDQRGHGRSEPAPSESWNLEQWAEDVHDLVQLLGLRRTILVGTSFGGFVVQRVLGSFPGLVSGGVVVGSSPRRAAAEEIVERYRTRGGAEAARVMATTMSAPSVENEAEWARVCGPPSRIRPQDEVLQRIVRERERRDNPEINEHFWARFGELDLRADLASVRDPMLVLVGASDPLTPPSVAAEIGE